MHMLNDTKYQWHHLTMKTKMSGWENKASQKTSKQQHSLASQEQPKLKNIKETVKTVLKHKKLNVEVKTNE